MVFDWLFGKKRPPSESEASAWLDSLEQALRTKGTRKARSLYRKGRKFWPWIEEGKALHAPFRHFVHRLLADELRKTRVVPVLSDPDALAEAEQDVQVVEEKELDRRETIGEFRSLIQGDTRRLVWLLISTPDGEFYLDPLRRLECLYCLTADPQVIAAVADCTLLLRRDFLISLMARLGDDTGLDVLLANYQKHARDMGRTWVDVGW